MGRLDQKAAATLIASSKEVLACSLPIGRHEKVLERHRGDFHCDEVRQHGIGFRRRSKQPVSWSLINDPSAGVKRYVENV